MKDERNKIIQLIHMALGFMVLTLFLIVFFVSANGSENFVEQSNDVNRSTLPTSPEPMAADGSSNKLENDSSLPLLLGMLSIGMIIGSAFIVIKFIPLWIKSKATQASNLENEKYGIFTTSHIIRIALLEGPTLMALIGFHLYLSSGGSFTDFNIT